MATKIRHVKAVIQLRRATESEWYEANPVLRLGEPAYSTDVNKLKIGDGNTDWVNLEYLGLSTEEIIEILDDYATKEYVEEHGGKIDSISIDGIEQIIDENKNVELHIPEYQAGPGIQINEIGGEETLLKTIWNHDYGQHKITFNFDNNLEIGKKYKYIVSIGYLSPRGAWTEHTEIFIFVWNGQNLSFEKKFFGEDADIKVYTDYSTVTQDMGITGYSLKLYKVAPILKEISLDDLLIDCGTSTTVI